ncbi:hypothetical protein Tco_0912656 [Tanacetum coccineum]
MFLGRQTEQMGRRLCLGDTEEPALRHKMLLMHAQDDWSGTSLCMTGLTRFDDDVDESFSSRFYSVGEYHEVHKMQNDVQPNYVVDSDVEYTSDSNIILYEQYVKDNAVQVVQSNVSSVPNDALMMIINDMHEQSAQCVSTNEQNKVVNESLTTELARYKEQVQLYEKRARFELTEREQKIDEQIRIIIQDRNVQEELLKKELHSVKMQLNSTINHNKLIKEEATTLKQDFKQKENKYLEEFLDMKQLKKIKTTHAPAVVHDSEDTLEIAAKTRIGMLEKMKSTLWVDSKIKIAPPDYSKENYLATFTLQ